MLAPTRDRLVLHTATLFVWVLAASCVGYWALQLVSSPKSGDLALPVTASEPRSNTTDATSLARLMGATAPQAAAPISNSNRFSLKGVVSGALGKEAALIVIDDKPAKAFRVGSVIEEGLILQSASARKVTLAATQGGPAVMTLEMPPLSPQSSF